MKAFWGGFERGYKIGGTTGLILLAFWLLYMAALPSIEAQAAPAAPAQGDTECVLWADIKPWAITRCESWETGEVCMIATSGFLVCRFD